MVSGARREMYCDRLEASLVVVREETLREGSKGIGGSPLICDVEDPDEQFGREGRKVVVRLYQENCQYSFWQARNRNSTLPAKPSRLFARQRLVERNLYARDGR